jgi:hypothetical protein
VRERLRNESGAVLIIVAVALPALILFAGLAIDTANWWVHKRHLQTQADAAALAGARQFKFPDWACDNSAIEQEAVRYSGGLDPEVPGITPLHNLQVGDTALADVHTEINEPRFFNQSKIVDDDLITEPSPCDSHMVDVKMTETDVPWFFKATGITEFIDAQARVELKPLDALSGLLPVGVEDVNPTRAHVYFYSEGQLLDDSELLSRDPNAGYMIWDNAGEIAPANTATFPVNAPPSGAEHRDIQMVVALSGSETSVTCGDPLVLCYGTPTAGVNRIRGYKTDTSGVHLEELNLTRGTCTDPSARENGYFATTCSTVAVSAHIVGLTDPALFADLTVRATSSGGDTDVLEFVDGRWVGELPVAGPGAQTVSISWVKRSGAIVPGETCRPGGQNPASCSGSYSGVHASYKGTRALTGPIKQIKLGLGLEDLNNVAACPAAVTCADTNFTVRIALAGNLQLAGPTDPPVALRTYNDATTAPGQTQSLDCDENVPKLEDEVAQGCAPAYRVNKGEECPNSLQGVKTLYGAGGPWPCVLVQTGNQTPKVQKGLNERILCRPPNSQTPDNCPPPQEEPQQCTNWNKWSGLPGASYDGDPRLMPVFVVPFGTFDGKSGSHTVPVQTFAFFYVTGWIGGPGNQDENPCNAITDPTMDDEFPPNETLQPGVVYGHFTSYNVPNEQPPGEGDCDVNSIGGCVAVLVK